MKPYLKFLLCALFSFSHASNAEVILIEPIEKGFGISEKPSISMYWQGKDSKALLLFIPGGDGRIGIKEGQVDLRHPYYQSLKRLSNPEMTSGHTDFVILDSPSELSPRQPYPTARGNTDHIVRIESAIRFYKEKTGLPIWLMGQSNGGISLTEFVKFAQKNKRMDLISGLILSGARSESNFNAPINMPVLFIHHKEDGCSKSTPSSAISNFQIMKKINLSRTEFVFITGGEEEANNPCHSGHHMFFGAAEEYSRAIDEFISANTK